MTNNNTAKTMDVGDLKFPDSVTLSVIMPARIMIVV